MSANDLKDDIADLLGYLLSASDRDDEAAFATIANHPAMVRAKEFVEKREPINFHFSVTRPVEAILGQLVRSSVASLQDDKEMLRNIEFIFLHAGEIELHYQRLIRHVEGFSCCADKSRAVMRALLGYFLNKDKIEFNYQQEYIFHLPKKVFVTQEEILEFYYGLNDFHYGNPDRYIKALARVLKEPAIEC